MKRILLASALCLASLAVGATAAGAGTVLDLGDLTVDPASGPAGTTFAVSGTGCTLQLAQATKGEPPLFHVELWFEAGDQSAEADAQQGAWSHEFTVPDGTEPGAYLIGASCIYGDGEVSRLVGRYNDGEFTVTEPATTTTVAPTTTTVAPTTTAAPTTTTTVAPATTQAAAAEAELPRTGGDPTALLAIGAASLGGGLTAFAARRRSRSRR